MSGPDLEAKREVWLLWESDQILTGVHPATWCSRECAVHNPSSHNMRGMKLGFDVDKKTMFRECTHGVKHHDPDERTYWTNQKLKALGKLTERAASRTKEFKLASEKLEAYGCPECSCGCCDITRTL